MIQLDAESRYLIESALDAFRRRDRVAARRLAQHAAALAPDHELPWLIMAVLGSPRASFEYVQVALVHNPESKEAQQALAWARSRLEAQTTHAAIQTPDAAVQPYADQPSSELLGGEVQEPTQPVSTVAAAAEPANVASQPVVSPAGEQIKDPDKVAQASVLEDTQPGKVQPGKA